MLVGEGRYVVVGIGNKNLAKGELGVLGRRKGTTALVTERPDDGTAVRGNGVTSLNLRIG